jgi:hypothetical protein
MLKKWNCNFLSIAIEEVSKNRLILRSFSVEQVPSSQEQELLLMMVAGITLDSFICCYVAAFEISITLVSSHLSGDTNHPPAGLYLFGSVCASDQTSLEMRLMSERQDMHSSTKFYS